MQSPRYRLSDSEQPVEQTGHRARLHEIIFEADTPAGKIFDITLLVLIAVSVVTVSLESVASIRLRFGRELMLIEWVLTALFTLEYVLRLYSVHSPGRYARSFFGIVDLLAILPTYLSLLIPGAQSLLVIRGIRMLRIFRVFKLARYVGETNLLLSAIRRSRFKLAVFFGSVLTIVVIVGAMMYLIEGPEHGFTSIPRGMYWAIVTMTTVGYGDISPETVIGQFVASILILAGYGLIVIPGGMFSVELARGMDRDLSTQACRNCSAEGHDRDARHCKYCGEAL